MACMAEAQWTVRRVLWDRQEASGGHVVATPQTTPYGNSGIDTLLIGRSTAGWWVSGLSSLAGCRVRWTCAANCPGTREHVWEFC